MPHIAYINKQFRKDTLAIIEMANQIIQEYQEQGFTLTLRQLYYQFVARALIENTERSYKRLGSIINDARMSGMIDWDAIEDRTRWLRGQAHWDSPADIVAACANQFQVDQWEGQPYRPEVWIEKDALIGVIEGVCDEYDVPYFACRGYVSQSEQWRAGRRLRDYASDGQAPIILHFGDHDPSGMDMTRDNRDRLGTFGELLSDEYELVRLALNMEQIDRYGPPPNPTKLSDSRANAYISEYGAESWELDALEPSVIATLIREKLESLIEPDAWGAAQAKQDEGRKRLQEAVKTMRKHG